MSLFPQGAQALLDLDDLGPVGDGHELVRLTAWLMVYGNPVGEDDAILAPPPLDALGRPVLQRLANVNIDENLCVGPHAADDFVLIEFRC